MIFDLLQRIIYLPEQLWNWLHRYFSTETKKDTGIVFLYLTVFCIFFYKAFTTTFMHADFIAYWVPHYKYIFQSIQSGFLPFWQPYSFMGVPEIFKLELVLFYPPVWILFILNFILNPTGDITFIGKSIELLQYVNMFLGSIGMYFLLRKIFKLDILPAFFGGIVFSFSFYMTIQSGDISSFPGKLLLPWMLLCLIQFIQKTNFKHYLLLVLVNYLLFTLGYPYNYVYFLFAQFGLALFFSYKKVVAVSLAMLNSALLAGFFLLPNLHILGQSFRGTSDVTLDPFFHLRNSYIPTKIINILNPQVFAKLYDSRDFHQLFTMGTLGWGTFPLIFLIIGFATIKWEKINIWLVLVFVLSIVISLGGYLNVPGLLGTIFPLIEKFRSHSQILSLTFFTGVIILSLGLQAVLKGYKSKRIPFFLWQIVIVLGVFLMIKPFSCPECTSSIYDVYISSTRSVLLLAIGLMLLHFTFSSKKIIFIVVGLIITLFEFSFYAENTAYLRMRTSYTDYFKPNSLIVERPSTDNMFRYSFSENQFIYNTSFLKIFNKEGYETVPYAAFYDLSRFGEERMLQFTNTKYVVTTIKDKHLQIPSLKLIKTIDPKEHTKEVFYGTVQGLAYFSPQTENPYYIYQVTNYYPRFFVPQKVQTCTNINCYKNENPIKLSFTKDTNVQITNPDRKQVSIKTVEYKPNSVSLEVRTPAKTFISSSEIWDKGWTLTIDNEPATLYKVSNGFRGFLVPKGQHTIVMSYFPPAFYEGLGVTVFGILMLFLLYQNNRSKKSIL